MHDNSLGAEGWATHWAPKTAIQTTKCTKHTKNERLAERTLFTHSAGTSIPQNLCCFVYLGSFVVPTTHSGKGRMQKAEGRKAATLMRHQSHPKATPGRRQNDECRKAGPGRLKPGTCEVQARYKPSASQVHAWYMHGTSYPKARRMGDALLSSTGFPRLHPWRFRPPCGVSTEPVPGFDRTGLSAIPMNGPESLVFTSGGSWRILPAGSAISPPLAKEKPVRQI
jgi:hypothetical protein